MEKHTQANTEMGDAEGGRVREKERFCSNKLLGVRESSSCWGIRSYWLPPSQPSPEVRCAGILVSRSEGRHLNQGTRAPRSTSKTS
jgi:hypothetical protein